MAGTATRSAGPSPMSSHVDIWNGLTLENGALALKLIPGVGGRLWDVGLDGDSLLFRNPDLTGQAIGLNDLSALPTRSPQFPFPLWGGEKTWIAPDSDWPNGAPYPVLDSGPYRVSELSADTVEMVSGICPVSGLEVTRRVILHSSATWSVRHTLRNKGSEPRQAGIWSVMMLNHPARIAVVTEQPEIRAVFGSDAGQVAALQNGIVCTCDAPWEYKVALPNPAGRVLIRSTVSDTWLSCRTRPPAAGDHFAHTMPFEVFNSGDYPYCEAEWHAPASIVEPGSAQSFEQVFHIWRGVAPFTDLALTPEEQEIMTCMF